MNNQALSDSARIIGERIRRERQRRHQTQEEFGRLLGISPSYLGALERGARPVSRHVMNLLHERLELSYDYLMEGCQTVPLYPAGNTLHEPGSYHVRRNLSLMLSGCTAEEARECYDLLHTYLSYVRAGRSTSAENNT